YDYTTYPGVERAAAVYGLTPTELASDASQAKLNPAKRASELAEAKIPVFIIHGKIDKVVPIAENSEALEAAYEKAGAGDLFEIIKVEDQGHNFWPGFFNCQELVDFLIEEAKAGES
ncbi:MAG: alpha/beta hydrolase, partial [Verrucomicrobiota bacterium]